MGYEYDSQYESYFNTLPFFSTAPLIHFDSEHYVSSIGDGRTDDIQSIEELDDVIVDNYQFWLRMLRFPDPELAIYRTPKNEADSGRFLIKSIRNALVERRETRLSEKPSTFVEVRVGLDIEGFPECVWHLAKCKENFCIRFIEKPFFPIWVTNENVDAALKGLV